MLRLLCRTFVVLLLLSGCATEPTRPELPPPPDQILWQRTLEDALAIAKVRHQPLLIAINMDGESASDRIYTERYRDPEFVAATRHCVCLGASVFRHNARDYDDEGRRIPCPRFGEITCGEHIALEPVLYEKYFADGDRVAPRHALILPDGKKAWDLSLCFDLKDIDRALFASVAAAPKTTSAEPRSRLAYEDEVAAANDVALAERLVLIAATQPGPRKTDVLLRLVPRLPSFDARLRKRFVAAAHATDPAAIAADLRQRLASPAGEPAGAEALLAVLAQLDDGNPVARVFAAAQHALTAREEPSFGGVLAAAAKVTAAGTPRPAPANGASDAMRPAAELERELADVEKQLAVRASDAALHTRFAKASLDLGRQHLDAGKKDARLLLEDAAVHFQKALALAPKSYETCIESARTAYFLQDFAGEVAFGRRALAIALPATGEALPPDVAAIDASAAEALRWMGDGHAHQLAEPAGQEEAAVREGLLALALVAASPSGDAGDWASFASYVGALSCWRSELQAAEMGAQRFPASAEIRAAISNALWNAGRIDLAPAVAARIAARAPGAESSWFTGQAYLFAAEDCRRRDDTAGAIAAYDAARAQFTAAAQQRAEFADDCKQRQANCWFGRGMALVRTNDRAGAVDCLAQAIAANGGIAALRDGLGYDALDLVDRALEWRESGPSPITATALCDRLAEVAPGEPFWPTAIADASIREALRADGRNPQRVEKETVDAGGKPIRMPMGLPTALGDGWLREAIAIARRAQQGEAEPALDNDRKTTFAQACTLWAERELERNQLDGVREALADAAATLGLSPPAADANIDALRHLAAQARAALGPARPRLREGR